MYTYTFSINFLFYGDYKKETDNTDIFLSLKCNITKFK